MEYTVIRSQRKTIGIQVKPDGRVVVRAPLKLSDRRIRQFVSQNTAWIEKHQRIVRERIEAQGKIEKFSEEELRALMEKAKQYIPERVKYYAPLVGVDYGRITIRCQKTRWGSCSAKGNLNFNCLLMLTPEEVLDSVVVHELCHRKEMNHSRMFYWEVERVFPDYKKWNHWLKVNGGAILVHLP